MIRPAFWEAPEAAGGLPPILSNPHAIYHSTPHASHVLKVCLLRRLHLIKNKVMALEEIHDHMPVCQPEPPITKETSLATFS